MHGSARCASRALMTAAALGLSLLAGTASAAPTASPSVTRTFVGLTPGAECRYGYLCAYVPGDGGLYRFDFKRCDTRYRVSRWFGRGFTVNAQYGGVTARFYTRSGRLYASRRARGQASINWDAVYSLRVC